MSGESTQINDSMRVVGTKLGTRLEYRCSSLPRWRFGGLDRVGSSASPPRLQFVLSIYRNPQDSEDLTQDVFLKIYGSLGSFDSTRGSFQVWIATLTRNLLVDHFRRSRQQRATDSIDAGWDDPEEGRPADRLTGCPAKSSRRCRGPGTAAHGAGSIDENLSRTAGSRDSARPAGIWIAKKLRRCFTYRKGTVKSRIAGGVRN